MYVRTMASVGATPREATASLPRQAQEFLDPLLHDPACFQYVLELARRAGIR
jgi:hypothetical protein